MWMTKNNWKKLILAIAASGLLTKAAEIALKVLLQPLYPKSPFLWVTIRDQSLILLPFIFRIQKMSENDLDFREINSESNSDKD
jgi:hypothetical protein